MNEVGQKEMEGKGEGRTEVKGKIFGDAGTTLAGLGCHFLWQALCSACGSPAYNLIQLDNLYFFILIFDPILQFVWPTKCLCFLNLFDLFQSILIPYPAELIALVKHAAIMA